MAREVEIFLKVNLASNAPSCYPACVELWCLSCLLGLLRSQRSSHSHDPSLALDSLQVISVIPPAVQQDESSEDENAEDANTPGDYPDNMSKDEAAGCILL